jgi:hypothetical protein
MDLNDYLHTCFNIYFCHNSSDSCSLVIMCLPPLTIEFACLCGCICYDVYSFIPSYIEHLFKYNTFVVAILKRDFTITSLQLNIK